MKKLFLILIFSVGLTNGILAQSSFEVTEQQLPYKKWATSFTINALGLGEGFVAYNWEKFIEDHGGTTYVTSSERGTIEMQSKEVKFPLLNDAVVEIFTQLGPNNTESGVLLTFWVKMKDGTYFSSESHKEEAKNIKSWLQKFNQELQEKEKKLVHG